MPVSIPSASHPVWQRIVCGKSKYQFEFIAVKIFLGHLTVKIKHNPDPDLIVKGARELREIFVKNLGLHSVQRDIEKLSG